MPEVIRRGLVEALVALPRARLGGTLREPVCVLGQREVAHGARDGVEARPRRALPAQPPPRGALVGAPHARVLAPGAEVALPALPLAVRGEVRAVRQVRHPARLAVAAHYVEFVSKKKLNH